jgi:LEA14-like dessication related protein
MKTLISTFFLGLIVLFTSCATSNIREPEYREIRDVRLIELGLLQSKAGIDFVYYNPNNFGVNLTEARGDVYIDDVYFGRFELDRPVQVRKNAEFVVPAIIKLDNIGAFRNHRDLINKKEAMVKIDGFARVKKAGISKEVPIKYTGKQNIERFRTLISTK